MIKRLQKIAAEARRNPHEYVAVFAVLCGLLGLYATQQQSDAQADVRDAHIMAAR